MLSQEVLEANKTDWPKCQIKECENEVDAYVYVNDKPLGFCHEHYYVPSIPRWKPEKLSWFTKLWRRFFGWSGPKSA